MNEYLKAFQNIALSSEALLTDDRNSQEIKQSAHRLKASVQPCLEELKQSAIKLKMYIESCFNNLNHAKNLWDSKPRIAAEPKDKIWEKLGELSGYHFQIYHIGNHLKREVIEEAKNYLNLKIEELRNKWFIDDKKQEKKGIGWHEKEGFIKYLRSEFGYDFLFSKINAKVSEDLKLMDREFSQCLNLEAIHNYINLFDWQRQTELNKKIELLAARIESNFVNETNYLYENNQKFKDEVRPALDKLLMPRLGDIFWKEVVNFKDEAATKIEAIINSSYDEKVKLATKVIDEAIAFYNEFLERQERYQQETPEQRQAEKDWIDKQRQELQRLQKNLELIINPFGGERSPF